MADGRADCDAPGYTNKVSEGAVGIFLCGLTLLCWPFGRRGQGFGFGLAAAGADAVAFEVDGRRWMLGGFVAALALEARPLAGMLDGLRREIEACLTMGDVLFWRLCGFVDVEKRDGMKVKYDE